MQKLYRLSNIQNKILILVLLLITQVTASENIYKQIEKQELYNHLYFKKLLHYRNGKSEIASDNFFVSKKGKTNLKEELFETIKSLQNGKNDTLCRFPLRVKWLKEKLPQLKKTIKTYECKKLDEFLEKSESSYVSLVFPSAHINSPASMYGHTFVKFSNDLSTPLIANAVNYAAQSNEKNGLIFAYRGLFGKYEGRYSILPYYKKIKEYNNLEQRDVWEYDLDFTKEEISTMILHIYEIKDSYSDYYFFLENCSYNVLWLFELARPNLDLISKFKLNAIPLDTIKVLKPYNLIKKSNFRYSKMRKMKYLLHDKIKNNEYLIEYLENDNFDVLDKLILDDKVAYMDFKIEYTQYKRSKNKIDEKNYIKEYLKLLRKRSKIKVKSTFNVDVPKNPIYSHDSAKVGMAYSTDDSIDLFFKPAYNDIYDVSDGYLQGAYIDFFSFKAKKTKDKTYLDEFILLNIESLSKRDIIFKPLSWGISLGYKHFKNLSDYVNLKPEVGLTYGNKNNFISLLAHAEIYYKKSNNISSYGAGVKAVSNTFNDLKLGSKYTYNFYDNQIKDNNIVEFFITKKIKKNLSLNIKYINDDFFEKDDEIVSFSFYYYF